LRLNREKLSEFNSGAILDDKPSGKVKTVGISHLPALTGGELKPEKQEKHENFAGQNCNNQNGRLDLADDKHPEFPEVLGPVKSKADPLQTTVNLLSLQWHLFFGLRSVLGEGYFSHHFLNGSCIVS